MLIPEKPNLTLLDGVVRLSELAAGKTKLSLTRVAIARSPVSLGSSCGIMAWSP